MGNCDVEKEKSDVVEWAIHSLSESKDEDEVNHAMQVLVNHGYVNLDGDTIELNPNKDGVKTELLIKQDVINLIGELNAISFYEANEHSKECYYDIRNAILAMPEQEPRWIPVSEPPQKLGTYLIQTDGEYMCECRWTDVNPYWTDKKTKPHWNIFDIPQYSKVVAWMPKPEPYKEESEEQA